MPIKAADLAAAQHLRLLVLGGPKTGKSCTVVSTAPGPVLVLNSDDQYSLRPVLQFSDGFSSEMMLGNDFAVTEKALAAARDAVKRGEFATIVWDTITLYLRRAEVIYGQASANDKGEWDGRRYHPMLQRHVMGILDRLDAIPAHLVVNAHYDEDSAPLLPGQTAKKGDGIVPMLPGKLRKQVAAWFQDIVFLEKDRSGARFFVTNDGGGVVGPGARNLPGNHVAPANIEALWQTMKTHNERKTSK